MAQMMKFARRATAKEIQAIRSAAKAKADKASLRVAVAAKKAVAESVAEAAAFPIQPFKQATQFCAAWRESESGTDHVVSLPVGFLPKDREGFCGIKCRVEEALAYQAATGQGYSKFFVHKDGERIGTGFFGAHMNAANIPYVFAELAASGYEAHLAYTVPEDALCLHDFDSAAVLPIVEAALAFESAESLRDGNAMESIIGEALAAFKASYPVPCFGAESFTLRITHIADRSYATEHLRFDAGERLPDHFAAMWHAERDRYQRILATCQPRNFMVFNVRDRRPEPTDLYEMRGELPYKYARIGAIHNEPDADQGGFDVYFHGCFPDEAPSAEVLAFVSCRLAATGRWLQLVTHQDDFVPPETLALILNAELQSDPTT